MDITSFSSFILSVKIHHFAINKISQSRMPISVWFSFAELEDMKMNKKNETRDGESWKNNDFPICKTIVRFALHRQHPLFVTSFIRSLVRSFGRLVVWSSACLDCAQQLCSIFLAFGATFCGSNNLKQVCLFEQLLSKHSIVNWFR